MEKEKFKVGDRVFVISHGWGIITLKAHEKYRIRFDKDPCHEINIRKYLISFTEYELSNFTQDRMKLLEMDKGKIGKFWDDNKNTDYVIDRLQSVNKDNHSLGYYYYSTNSGPYRHFKPLTEEQVRILESWL